MIQRRTVGIVGTGNVGVAAAYAMFIQGLASELILVDIDEKRAEGEAMDLMHGQLLAGSMRVHSGRYDLLEQAQVVVVTAGVGQRPGESRLDLLNRNADIFRGIMSELDSACPDAIVVVATNPVDILTYIAQELSQRPNERIIGTGTLLDTARFRALLGEHYGVDPRSVHAYILGEHGDSEVPIWSNADIGGKPISDGETLGIPFRRDEMNTIFEKARTAAYQIIQRKGYTNTAIGVVIARIVRAILGDERSVLPVSVRTGGEYGIEGVCLSLPCIVGASGAGARVLPELNDEERQGLCASATILRDNLRGLEIRNMA